MAGEHTVTLHDDTPDVFQVSVNVLDERPGVTEIRTGNADSNDAMLGIDRLMGYRPMISATVWELPVETAERWLAAR